MNSHLADVPLEPGCGAGPGDLGTGAGTAEEGASKEEAGKACGGQGIRL